MIKLIFNWHHYQEWFVKCLFICEGENKKIERWNENTERLLFPVMWSALNQRGPELRVLLQNKLWHEQKLWPWTPEDKFLPAQISVWLLQSLPKVKGCNFCYLFSWRKSQYLSTLSWIWVRLQTFSKIAAKKEEKKILLPLQYILLISFRRKTKTLTSWHYLTLVFFTALINCDHHRHCCGVCWSFQQSQAIVLRLKRCCQQHCFLFCPYFYSKCQNTWELTFHGKNKGFSRLKHKNKKPDTP